MKLVLIVLLTVGLSACSEPEEQAVHQPMSLGAQCIRYGYWCNWPICGPCAGAEPQTGSEDWRYERDAPGEIGS